MTNEPLQFCAVTGSPINIMKNSGALIQFLLAVVKTTTNKAGVMFLALEHKRKPL